MPSAFATTVIGWGGGWAPDAGNSFSGAPQNGILVLPFLKQADNVLYEIDGAPRKVGGTTRYNATAITESAVAQTITGLYDYFAEGVSRFQKRIAVAGTQILKDDLDGTWDVIKTGLESNKHPAFCTFNDDLIVATDSNSDVPQTWDGSEATTQNLGGSPPNFAFMVPHKNRVWAAGVAANPSRLYYSDVLLHESWTSAGAGSIDIDPNDGDRITGLFSHKNELFVFKGPNVGSVHRITGSSPTGADAFARVPFIADVGSANHTSILRANDDVLFVSDFGIHSLAVTASYGDYVQGYLSFQLQRYFAEGLSHTAFETVWGINYFTKGSCWWTFARSGSAKDIILAYDYRFKPGRWSRMTGYLNVECLALMHPTFGRHRPFGGTTTGFVHVLDEETRTIAPSTAYTSHVHTPSLNFGSSANMKTLEQVFVTYEPQGTGAVTLGATMDFQAEQQVALTMAGGDTLT